MYIKEMDDVKQVNLEEDGTYILQNGDNTFIWFGKETPITSVKLWENIIIQFLRDFPQENTQTFKVAKQGLEPDTFIQAFQKWDPYMWQKQNSYEINREEVLRFNEIEDAK
ncbi:villin-1-like [Vanessa cardui]|uniref:villin-1-like n=1 Tax=Vanessa cardui TaxID=171605 RepID=UPI001F13A719|nr:villin-1-like [Vanessa cardui]